MVAGVAMVVKVEEVVVCQIRIQPKAKWHWLDILLTYDHAK